MNYIPGTPLRSQIGRKGEGDMTAVLDTDGDELILSAATAPAEHDCRVMQCGAGEHVLMRVPLLALRITPRALALFDLLKRP
jgi:hypothetical protein